MLFEERLGGEERLMHLKTTYDISLDPAVIKITSQVSFRCSPEPKDLLFNDAAVNLSFSFRTPSLVAIRNVF
jgi:hypothetical protein